MAFGLIFGLACGSPPNYTIQMTSLIVVCCTSYLTLNVCVCMALVLVSVLATGGLV